MKDFVIDVSKVEEWQMLNDRSELEKMIEKSKSALVNGAKVIFVRGNHGSPPQKFEEIDNLADLEKYKERVFKYLK